MIASKIVIGDYYRHKDHPTFCWAKALKVLKPNEGENTLKKIIVKCEYSTDKDSLCFRVMYFKPSDLILG
jgi:hypothetical protein